MINREFVSIRRRFLEEYFRNHREIGSIVPDSATCVKGLLRSVPFDSSDVIVEFGSASGAVTREIVRSKRRESMLICFEKSPLFYSELSKTLAGQNVFFIQADALNAANLIAGRFSLPEKGVDCIVSTLPCSSIAFEELLRFAVLPLIKDGGVFIQYMHVLSLFKGFRLGRVLKQYFSSVSSDIVFLNFPPALVYSCRK